MNDLKLMELLESEGYEVSIENLQILKEGLDNGSIVLTESIRGSMIRFCIRRMNENKLDKLSYKIFEKMEKKADKIEVLSIKKAYMKASIDKKREYLLKVVDKMEEKDKNTFNKIEDKLEDTAETNEKTLKEEYFTPERGKVALAGLIYLLIGTCVNLLLWAFGGPIFLLLIPAWILLAHAVFGSEETINNYRIAHIQFKKKKKDDTSDLGYDY